ncbi:MAG TPA: DNA replication and repair protein RecF [Solirubrobacterales bacterium]|nr:DNA replication and repair protein RecF [Solirubrobacterales bacterium]HMU26961.1 DNA replication and repair protein RecF [Solirubrobacterales bacterium]HMX71567.1 DNA replication and repair protein RecF [Solirubrobacterales bacterium]HMY26149.1 DNA replication and repair protein RecF [Solirubrobacterales bacterium]HNA23949.1 DNA replication and repair protein RecF [Solirubrobacterales bacterium]
MIVSRVEADQVRSLAGVIFEPDPGLTVIIGPNGAGKTNLVEAIYFGLTSRSFRTSDRRDLIPFGSAFARCRVTVQGGGVDHVFMASASRSEGNRFTMDGARIEQAEAVLHRPKVTVFSPDRLELVKGPPAGRRAHLDSFVAARWPSRAGLRSTFGRILAQRNALIARISSAEANSSQLATWNSQFAEAGANLASGREAAVEALAERWVEAADDLGLEGPKGISYRPGSATTKEEIEAGLEERLEHDLRLGRSSWGPHHDEVRLELDGRQLRRFGSQGQQRLGLLALLFAERAALLDAGEAAPLMLLDDVMSELDAHRRGRLVERLLGGGQSVITAAEGELIPERQEISRVAIRDLVGADEERDNGEDPGAGSGGGTS